MPSSIVIRPVRSDDLDSVYAVLYETWLASYVPILGETAARKLMPGPWLLKANLDIAIASAEVHFDVAEVGGKIVGLASGGYGVWFRRYYLWMLYVLPEFQGQGAGRLLLDTLLSNARNYQAVRLQVLSGNVTAQAFYERRGFEIVCESWHLPHWQRIKVMERKRRACDSPAKGIWGYMLG